MASRHGRWYIWILIISVVNFTSLKWFLDKRAINFDDNDEESLVYVVKSERVETTRTVPSLSKVATMTSAKQNSSCTATSVSKKPKVFKPWGLRKIIDPYRDLVFFTLVTPTGFRDLRELIGSIHALRPLASQTIPIIYVYGHLLQKREIDELTLWRNVVYQELSHVLTPFTIFDGLESLNKTLALPTSIDKSIFNTEDDTSIKATKSIKDYLMSRVVHLHGHAIYIKNGNILWKNHLKQLHQQLEEKYYFSHVSVYGETVVEAYVAETEPFKCGIQAIWDPSKVKECTSWKKVIGNSGDFGIDQAPASYDEVNVNACDICIRDDAHHGWNFFVDHRKSSIQSSPFSNKTEKTTGRRRVALAFPTTSRNTKTFWDLSFLSIFLPTISKSLGYEDLRRYELVFYIGFDEGDPVYESRESIKRIVTKTLSTFTQIGVKNVRMNFVKLGVSKAVAYIWNVLFSLSMADGIEYFFQVNDDVRFISFGWLHTFISQLGRQNGFGVVGPNDLAFDCKIMTQAMVTRVHYNIFGWFFPPEFRNWHCDTWISLVYAMHSKCYAKMAIWNGRYSVPFYSPRYQPCRRVDFKPLTLHYQGRLKNSQGRFDPSLHVNLTTSSSGSSGGEEDGVEEDL